MPKTSQSDDMSLLRGLEDRGPMNMERALQVMELHGLDGIVVGAPENVFHMTGHWPQIARTRIGQPPGTFAMLTRRNIEEIGLVTSSFLYFYTWSDGRMRADVEPWLYNGLGDEGDFSPAPRYDFCADQGAVPLSSLESHRRAMLDAGLAQRQGFHDAGAALVRAIQDLGLWKGRIGFDDPVVKEIALRHEMPGDLVPADNILREIRLIKSPLEIALMRRAAEANVQALNAVGAAVRAGATHRDLQNLYLAETATRGNKAVFLNVDRVSSELSAEAIRDGQALFLDGVSHFMNYHGDFARTVFVGEPTPTARRAAEAAAFGWSAIRENLRPGLRYSEIVSMGQEAVTKKGFGVTIGFGPHSVGLAHTDEPGELAGGFYRKPDIVLAPGMILSVDCPVLDTGIGGSAHCEDLMLITADGAEPIHSLHEPVIII
ncbi:M24 family metallopeptidase [Sphingorhabdus sp. YGSMI21]|uniref:M24 family metallopeptidase n=1 Tax=Sphingorhabdus sp. YGSMI21 TaxID=2077182 RepID=UPI000C1F4C6C|nr:M24 family metallopeptidase [Sphingorhabdus sp. YGSMI21]ATW05430.1 peptidase M24 [Sphingorhabdus sp. YGSMI21]